MTKTLEIDNCTGTFPNDTDITPMPNCSMRRQGVSVVFDCEMCSARPVLDIAQHKGTTLVRWRRLDWRVGHPDLVPENQRGRRA